MVSKEQRDDVVYHLDRAQYESCLVPGSCELSPAFDHLRQAVVKMGEAVFSASQPTIVELSLQGTGNQRVSLLVKNIAEVLYTYDGVIQPKPRVIVRTNTGTEWSVIGFSVPDRTVQGDEHNLDVVYRELRGLWEKSNAG